MVRKLAKPTKATKAETAAKPDVDQSIRRAPRGNADLDIVSYAATKHPGGYDYPNAESAERHQSFLAGLKKRYAKKPFTFSEAQRVFYNYQTGEFSNVKAKGSACLGDKAVLARLIARGDVNADKAGNLTVAH